jgi:hypothetical protein
LSLQRSINRISYRVSPLAQLFIAVQVELVGQESEHEDFVATLPAIEYLYGSFSDRDDISVAGLDLDLSYDLLFEVYIYPAKSHHVYQPKTTGIEGEHEHVVELLHPDMWESLADVRESLQLFFGEILHGYLFSIQRLVGEMKVFDGKSYLNGYILHLGSITAHTSDSLHYFVHGIYLPVIAKLPVPEVEYKLFRYLAKIK